mmetsp:Transcript_114090/g.179613  ORF Transcript_114090/g.179613 Transcript_114090/m.179613 type:complete len:234 (-) Transcript_114090:515-1216(-)
MRELRVPAILNLNRQKSFSSEANQSLQWLFFVPANSIPMYLKNSLSDAMRLLYHCLELCSHLFCLALLFSRQKWQHKCLATLLLQACSSPPHPAIDLRRYRPFPSSLNLARQPPRYPSLWVDLGAMLAKEETRLQQRQISASIPTGCATWQVKLLEAMAVEHWMSLRIACRVAFAILDCALNVQNASSDLNGQCEKIDKNALFVETLLIVPTAHLLLSEGSWVLSHLTHPLKI